jgi:hypothetical protein
VRPLPLLLLPTLLLLLLSQESRRSMKKSKALSGQLRNAPGQKRGFEGKRKLRHRFWLVLQQCYYRLLQQLLLSLLLLLTLVEPKAPRAREVARATHETAAGGPKLRKRTAARPLPALLLRRAKPLPLLQLLQTPLACSLL